MQRKSRDAAKEEVKLELTPMIDVTFLVLVFFMCTLKFKTLERKLVSYLPTDSGIGQRTAPIEKEHAVIALRVPREDREKPIAERTVLLYRRGSDEPLGRVRTLATDPNTGRVTSDATEPAGLFDEVARYLASVRQASPEAGARIDSWPGVPHGHVVQVLNLMVAAGFRDISYTGIPARLMQDLESGRLK